MEDLKPEAAYFFPNSTGLRSGVIFFDMAENSQIVTIVESFASVSALRSDSSPS